MTGTWAAGWADGDTVTAAEFKKSAGSIYDSTLGGSAATIDVTGILGTYAHLMISLYGRGDTAASGVTNFLRFNGDSAANYDFEILQGNAAATAASETFAGGGVQIGSIPAATASANLFGACEVFIPNYGGSTNNKSYVAISGNKNAATTGNIFVQMLGGGWRSNAAISRITFLPSAGNYVAGTRVTIHALGA